MRSDRTIRTYMLVMLAVGLAGATIVWAEAPAAPAAPPQGDSANSGRGTERRGPRADWELSFPEGLTVVEYARRLDHFGIEIAAVSSKGKIEYIAQSSQPKPTKRVGTLSDDPRLYIGWKGGELVAADRKLLAKAGIHAQGKDLWHFFPAATQQRMAEVERAHANRDPKEIKRTRFEIRPAKKQEYEFVVVEQDLIDDEGATPSPPRNSSSEKR